MKNVEPRGALFQNGYKSLVAPLCSLRIYVKIPPCHFVIIFFLCVLCDLSASARGLHPLFVMVRVRSWLISSLFPFHFSLATNTSSAPRLVPGCTALCEAWRYWRLSWSIKPLLSGRGQLRLT